MSNRYKGGFITASPPTTSSSSQSAPGIWTTTQQMQISAAGNWPPYLPPDPYFDYVTLLLNGDGTNGAQNNTFLDSSSNAFSITRNGNTTQGSFSPYGSLWSNYFDGLNSNNYLSVGSSNNTNWAFGTGDFTVEFWFFSPGVSTGNSTYQAAMGCYGGGTGWIIYSGGGANNLSWYSLSKSFGLTYTPNQWNHLAVSRTSGVTKGFINGVELQSVSDTSNYGTDASHPLTIGAYWQSAAIQTQSYFNGYISNVRIVKGTGLYSGNFTPSTTPLTAVTNTVLLTCQSNRFIDNSSNNYSIVVSSGTPSVQRFSPFNPTVPYSTATIGGSGYFDGSGDYLALAAGNSAFDLSSGDSTIEGWYYPTAFSSNKVLCGITDATTSYYRIYVDSTGTLNLEVSGQTTRTTSATMKLNAWNYFSISKNGSGIYLAINGTVESFGTYALGYDASVPFLVGARTGPGLYVTGYMSDVRVVKGTALRTSTYTPPTSPLTAISGTQYLGNMTNAGIPDSAMMNDLETVGSAQVSTSVKKFGTGSIYFSSGTGSFLRTNDGLYNSSFTNNYICNFGTGDFTIECWVYSTTFGSNRYIFDTRPDSTNGAYSSIYTNSSGQVIYLVSGTARITSSAISTNTWTHVAICRSGTSTKMFIDGTQAGSTWTDSTNYLNSNQISIASSGYSQGGSFVGYIDDLRITKGYARYTANFTPPTAALPTF